jgi:hypothetical protein
MGGLLVVLLFVAVAFGTSALLFPVVIAAAIIAVIAVLYVLGAVGSRTPPAGPARDPVRDAAPASGEGSDPARG